MKILSSNSKRLFLSSLIVAGLFVSVPVKAETELLFNLFVPPKHPFNTGMFIPWAKDVMRVAQNHLVKENRTVGILDPLPLEGRRPAAGPRGGGGHIQ